MTRRCSHCAQQNHNSRTCPERGVRLFGVRINDQGGGEISENMRKSASMGNLSNYSGASGDPGEEDRGNHADGYLSDGLVHDGRGDRKRGIPWTEEEHRLFLLGLQKLGKGDWRGISRTYVQSRTPTQVASHAQKYFIRQSNLNKRKRRSSLFDLVTDLTPSSSAPNLRVSASSEDIRSLGMPPLSPTSAAPSYGPPPTFHDPGRKPSNFPLPSSSYPPPQFHFPDFPPQPRLAPSYSFPNHFPGNIPFSPPNYISPGFGAGFAHHPSHPSLVRHSTYPQFPVPPPMPAPMTSSIAHQQQMAAAAVAATEMVRAASYERLHDLGGASVSEQRTEVTKPIAHKASPSHPPPQLPPPAELDGPLRDAPCASQQPPSEAPHSFSAPSFHTFSHMPWLGMGPFYGMVQIGGSGTNSKVCRPTASHPSAPLDIPGCFERGGDDRIVGEGVSPSPLEPSPLTAKLLGEGPLRHSAFQSKLAYKEGALSNGESNSVIKVV